MKYLEEFLLVVLGVSLVILVTTKYGENIQSYIRKPAAITKPATVKSAPPTQAQINEYKQALSNKAQYVTALHFCVVEYRRDSCLHHLIHCGEKCKSLIPKEQFTKIKQDYQALMIERKLAI